MTTRRTMSTFIECDEAGCDEMIAQRDYADPYFKLIKSYAQQQGWRVSPGGKATCARCRTDVLMEQIV